MLLNAPIGMSSAISLVRRPSSELRTAPEVTPTEAEAVSVEQRRYINSQQPAVRLPNEVLCYTFELACISRFQPSPELKDYHYDKHFHRHLSLRSVRHSISATCTHWRDVALATTSLWSLVTLTSFRMPANVKNNDEDIDESDFCG